MADARAEVRALVERFHSDVWNRGDEEVARSILSSDLGLGGSTGPGKRGVGRFVGHVRLIRGARSGYACVIEDAVVERPRLFARMLFRGTHAGPLFGVPPTGDVVSRAGAALVTVAGSRMRSVRVLGDVDASKQQLALTEPVPP